MKLMRRTLNPLVGMTIALTLSGAAGAQTKPCEAQPPQAKPCEAPPPPEGKPCEAAAYPNPTRRRECYQANRVIKTYYLANASRFQQNEANEILIALRNILDVDSKMYLAPAQNAIILAAPPDQQELAQKVVAELDLPKKAFHLNFTLEELDGTKRISVQHYSMDVLAGQRTTLKQGNRVPIITSTYNANGQSAENMFQYTDVGMNFDTTLEYTPGGLHLQFRVEESSVSDEHMSGALSAQPVIRQTVLTGMSALTLGKPHTLGSIDVPGTTRHIEIQATVEPAS